MKKRICVALSLIALTAFLPPFLFSQNRQQIFPLSSPLYRYMDALYLEAGMVHPNKARPWTGKEAALILERIDTASLSRAGRRAYRYILEEIGSPERERPLEFGKELRLAVDGALSFEGFSRFNLESDGAMKAEDYQWLHGYEERKPLLTIPIEVFLGDSIYMLSEMSVKEEHGTVNLREHKSGGYPDGVKDNYFNLLFDDPNERLDLYFPFRAFISTGGERWNLQFGRDSLSWGNGQTGNLLLSDYSDFYDSLGLSFFGRRVKLSSVYAVMDPFTPGGDPTTSHAFLGRRLDIRITDRILLSLNESVTIGDDHPNLVKDLNYLMIFHNWTTPDRMNSLMTAELSLAPWRSVNLYGQIAMDEFETRYEAERTGGGGPPIFGYLAGFEGAWPVGEGYLSGGFEWVQTSPWLYHRRDAPYFYNVREYYSLTTDQKEYIVKPIGYRYGPDSQVWHLQGRYDVPGGLSAAASLTWLRQGERRYLPDLDPEFEEKWDDEDGDGPDKGITAPSGIVQNQLILHLAAEYPFRPWLTAGAGLYLSAMNNRANVRGQYSYDLELTSFVTLRLP